MRRMALLCVLLVGLVGIAAPTITLTPWRYGVVYWVGEVPENPEVYLNMATNWVGRVFAFWGLTPLPRPTGDWRAPQQVSADSLQEARLTLGPDFSPAGVIVPGPEEGSYWALAPLRLGEREIMPLTLVVFPEVGDLQASLCRFSAGGVFVRDPSRSASLDQLDPPIASLLREVDGPVVAVPVVGRPPLTTRDYFLEYLAHEIAHWATLVWSESLGLDMDAMPLLLTEGLAEYTRFTVTYGEPRRHPIAPSSLHPVAAVWAEQGSLLDAPRGIVYELGLSLVDFIVRRDYLYWERVLRLLPEWLDDWTARLSDWDDDWRAWLRGEVPPWAPWYAHLLAMDAFHRASFVEPLFPDVWDRLWDVTDDEGLTELWDTLSVPPASLTPDALEKLRVRECVFRLFAVVEAAPPEVRERAQAILARLAAHWAAGEWEQYVATYLEAVRWLFEG